MALSCVTSFLSVFDFSLLSDIVNEWFSFPTLSTGLSYWKSFSKTCTYSLASHLNVLLFNVRGLEKRWEEVLLLFEKYKMDVLVLLEVGAFELSLFQKIFINFKYFYQKGENAWGGVILLFKSSLPVVRVKCDIPNICVVDIKLEQTLRLVGIYAPKSKTWGWNNLSQYITDFCCLFGDFNIDLDLTDDEKEASNLLSWSDSLSLSPVLPGTSTSLRSDRMIDYAFTRGIPLTLQSGLDNTISDHKPIIGMINWENKENIMGSNIHWKVFNYFLALTVEFWEEESSVASADNYYTNFINLLESLKARCTSYFPLKKYRAAIPRELRQKLSYTRALSFQHKRTGDVILHKKIKELRRSNRNELVTLRAVKLTSSMNERYSSSSSSNSFWSNLRKNFHSTSSLNGLIDENNKVVRDTETMLNMAANHYESLFMDTQVFRPHPYVDSPDVHWDNYDDAIPPITLPELLKVLAKVKNKHSSDAHGISPFMIRFIPGQFMRPLLRIFNGSFSSCSGPSYWKHVKMKLLAKKDPICSIVDTRPISLLDTFLKVLERLMLNRFHKVLENRGILHDSQSGFRSNFRLQSRVLLLIDQISSLMSMSAPTATVFIDFKQAFDQLWWTGCLGKLGRLGIPKAYVLWLEYWLRDRKGYIEMNNKCSRSFPILRGGPQGSCLTPAVFITYHCDMWTFLQNSLPHFYADDLACVLSGMMGVKYSQQCLDLEMRLKKLIDHLEYYAVLSVQPINYAKTEMLWTARAVGEPKFNIQMGDNEIAWVNNFKYLGYYISSKLGWGKMISTTKSRIRQRVAIAMSCRIFGSSSKRLRRILFSTYILPLFTWLFAIFPLFTGCQRDDLSHFYFTCMKRMLGASHWNDFIFSSMFEERSLENLCNKYWCRYRKALNNSVDGSLLFEQFAFNSFRNQWLDGESVVKWVYRSHRLVPHLSIVEQCLHWLEDSVENSIPHIDDDELKSLSLFPQSFL